MEISPISISRRDRERLLRRSEILSASKILFAEKGYSEATLTEIASRAEFGKGTIYNYFPGGKEEILVAVFDQLYESLLKIISESFEPDESLNFRDAMRRFLGRSFDFFVSNINLFLILIKEAERTRLNHHSETAARIHVRHDEIIHALSIPLSTAMKRGDLRKMPPTFLAHMIFLNLKGYHLRQCPQSFVDKAPPDLIETDQFADELTDFILFGASGPSLSHLNPGGNQK